MNRFKRCQGRLRRHARARRDARSLDEAGAFRPVQARTGAGQQPRRRAVSTIDEFAANFALSAELLNSANNFIPNRLANLDRVIDYIDANKTSLQQEFGSGDAAKATGELARALAAYQQMAKA